jgi:hypothetical protein
MNMKQKINDILKIQVRFLVQLIKKVLLTYVYVWHRPLMLTAGYPKALIPFHVPNNIPSTSTWPVCTRHK